MPLVRNVLRKGGVLLNRVRWARWRNANYVSQARPIIIGGCPRSGTTLMRVILDTHPNICCGPESAFFIPERFHPKRRIEKLAWKFDIPVEVVESLLKEAGSLTEFIETFFGEYCRRSGKNRWAEKTPRNILHLGFIFKHFPNAVFIHMIRDGRDVVCSLRTFPKYKMVDGKLVDLDTWNPLDVCIKRWVQHLRVGFQYRGDPRYKEVRYESLVLNTKETLVDLFNFLEEPWDSRVLDYHKVVGGSRSFVKFPQNPEATKPIYSRSIGRWRRDLSAEDRKLFKQMAGALLIELGYASSDDW